MWKRRHQGNSLDDRVGETTPGEGEEGGAGQSQRWLSVSTHSSRYEIGHGSSDYHGYIRNTGGGTDSSVPSPSIDDAAVAAAAASGGGSSSGLDSPGSEGLHHRKIHINHKQNLQHPVQQAAAVLTSMTTGAKNTTTTTNNHHHAGDLHLQHPLASMQQRSNNGLNHTGRGRSTFHRGLPRGHKKSTASSSSAWKKLVQCAFITLLLGYMLFLYLAQNHYLKKEEYPHHGHHGHPLGQQDGKADDARHAQPSSNRKDSFLSQQNSRDDQPPPDHHFAGENRTLDIPLSRPLGDMHDYAFKPIRHQLLPKQPLTDQSVLAYQRRIEWSANSLQHSKTIIYERRKNRRQRTIPPKHVVKKSKGGRGIPLWYELQHSSEDTILSLHSRWNEGDDSSASATATASVDPSTFCGTHAQKAAKHHPQNYRLPSKLGPQSRVFISGILSPLGLHLTIALHRQCGVKHFLGLDTMFPNEPFSRLEYQDRLAVLMGELGDAVELQVPFLGLESKQIGNQQLPERMARDEMLVELRAMNDIATVVNDTRVQSSSSVRQYAIPNVKYGIHLTPGTARDGSGTLNAVLDYRPTHIVHLAGTQSDSLLNSNRHGESDNGVSPHGNAVFRNKDEEEEDILQESISSRPHLYDLRMGAVGMEQLLSAAVAQTMLPPTVGRVPDTTTTLSESDSDKMTRPHIVYASTHDALLFHDTAARIEQEEKKKVLENENLGSTSSPQPKRPSRGLHGASRLIDEIISSSYHSLHNIPSIGLQFDAIYGPRGFGVSSASVPIFYTDRNKKPKRGISPDVDLAETAVRRLYRKWMDAVKAKAGHGDAKKHDDEKQAGDIEDEGEKEEDGGRRLEESRHLNLLEEAGWTHAAHDRRDFVFVEGESATSHGIGYLVPV